MMFTKTTQNAKRSVATTTQGEISQRLEVLFSLSQQLPRSKLTPSKQEPQLPKQVASATRRSQLLPSKA
jgi:hypothetical protein